MAIGVALAAALIVPTALNCSVGARLGIWWAPFPFWIFLVAMTGLPLQLVALVPSILFGATALLARRPLVAAGVLIAASLIHVLWAIAFSLMRASAWYVFGVQPLGAALLAGSAVRFSRGKTRSSPCGSFSCGWRG